MTTAVTEQQRANLFNTAGGGLSTYGIMNYYQDTPVTADSVKQGNFIDWINNFFVPKNPVEWSQTIVNAGAAGIQATRPVAKVAYV